MEQTREVLRIDRTHRVGTVTLGLTLLVYGMIYLLRLIWQSIPVMLILRLWPMMLISLGVEVLLAGIGDKHFVIDKAAIVLSFLTVLFIFGMAAVERMLVLLELGYLTV